MKRIELTKQIVVSDGAAKLSVETYPVNDGEVLIVNTIAGYHDNQAATEVTEFFLTDGATEIDIDSKLAVLANYPVGIRGRIVVPSGYRIGVRLPAAANTEKMYLSLTGEIMSLEAYRKLDLV